MLYVHRMEAVTNVVEWTERNEDCSLLGQSTWLLMSNLAMMLFSLTHLHTKKMKRSLTTWICDDDLCIFMLNYSL
ncbi:unnamed protein product [Eruca vesicaria subsp. sativa]|uniref:Uncharacterized protein n=1 Tax=Eruca vesicaria subsp. sativa TaxID=29727 RepID=A0ABC8KGX1_ERUVS|nr:unnamed protein product [Eruca vesicaria subsp. sativa]